MASSCHDTGDPQVPNSSTGGRDVPECSIDTSSSSMDLAVDDEDVQKLIDLEQRLEDSGHLDIPTRKEYLATLRRCGMKEKLRDARYSLHAVFPLDESLWLEWVADESEALASADDVVKLDELFRMSHYDCVSVSLWKEHIECVAFLSFLTKEVGIFCT